MSAQAAAGQPRAWWSYVEPWAGAYALMGFTVSGALPILLPLAVARAGTAADVGLVMASLSPGDVMSPLCGALADRYRIHRNLRALGVLTTGIAVTLCAWATGGVLGGLLAGWTAQRFGDGAIAGAICLGAALLLTRTDPTWIRTLSIPTVPTPRG